MFAALHPDKEAHASRAAFDRLLLTATNASALRRTATGVLLPGPARLLCALAAGSFHVGLITAAPVAATATTLGAAGALAAAAGGPGRARDRRRPRLIHSLLPQTSYHSSFFTLVHDLLPPRAPLSRLRRYPIPTARTPRRACSQSVPSEFGEPVVAARDVWPGEPWGTRCPIWFSSEPRDQVPRSGRRSSCLSRVQSMQT